MIQIIIIIYVSMKTPSYIDRYQRTNDVPIKIHMAVDIIPIATTRVDPAVAMNETTDVSSSAASVNEILSAGGSTFSFTSVRMDPSMSIPAFEAA